MPRSGTTLTEQILARHSKALNIGERNFFSQSFNTYISTHNQQPLKELNRLNNIKANQVQRISVRYLQQLQKLKDKAGVPDAIDKVSDNYS